MADRRRITDAAALKALAHPLRMELLGALVTEGPMTASQAAEVVGESPSNCSWHLRKLAEHGFVEEAPGGTGRNRPWRAVSEGLEWDEHGEDPATRIAADALTDALIEHELDLLRAARARRDDEPAAWREATGLSQSRLWLTADEAADLTARIRELLGTHLERHRNPDARPPGARQVALVAWLTPAGPPRGAEAPLRDRRATDPDGDTGSDPSSDPSSDTDHTDQGAAGADQGETR